MFKRKERHFGNDKVLPTPVENSRTRPSKILAKKNIIEDWSGMEMYRNKRRRVMIWYGSFLKETCPNKIRNIDE